MIYKGWQIFAVINAPRAYEVLNTGIRNSHFSIKYGKEIEFSPKLNPYHYNPYQYIAKKNDEYIDSRTISGLKEKIDLRK